MLALVGLVLVGVLVLVDVLVPVGTLSGMDQGSDFVSDFRARRIRTQSLGKFYRQTVTRLLSFASLVPALPVPEPVAATSREGWGMIWDLFPGINSPGQASVGYARGFSGACTRL